MSAPSQEEVLRHIAVRSALGLETTPDDLAVFFGENVDHLLHFLARYGLIDPDNGTMTVKGRIMAAKLLSEALGAAANQGKPFHFRRVVS